MDNALAPKSTNALRDVLYRTAASTLGAPVDLATLALRPFGYSTADKNVVGSSEWIGAKMEAADLVSPERRPLAEFATGLAMPAAVAAKTILSAAKSARAAQQAAKATADTEAKLAGLRQAQQNNTFVYERNHNLEYGFGSRQGYPQPKGTPSDKLFSNFADHQMSPERLDSFRRDIFARALTDPKLYTQDTVYSTVIPFREGLDAVIEATKTGNTRVQVLKDGTPVASAKAKNGLIDSIGVSKEMAGQHIGLDLLRLLHEKKIANVFEVPDRSPGFVKIQKQLVQELTE